jgi:hypothetical protein
LATIARGRRHRHGVRGGEPAAAFDRFAFVFFVWAYMIRNDPLGIDWLLATSAYRTTASLGLIATMLVLVEAMSLIYEQHPGGAETRSADVAFDPAPAARPERAPSSAPVGAPTRGS